MRYWFKFGHTKKEQADWLSRISAIQHTRSSRNPWDLITVSWDGSHFVLTGGQPDPLPFRDLVEYGKLKAPDPVLVQTKRDAERFLSHHYRKVRERLAEACHY